MLSNKLINSWSASLQWFFRGCICCILGSLLFIKQMLKKVLWPNMTWHFDFVSQRSEPSNMEAKQVETFKCISHHTHGQISSLVTCSCSFWSLCVWFMLSWFLRFCHFEYVCSSFPTLLQISQNDFTSCLALTVLSAWLENMWTVRQNQLWH